jgi:hypothetical protein
MSFIRKPAGNPYGRHEQAWQRVLGWRLTVAVRDNGHTEMYYTKKKEK